MTSIRVRSTVVLIATLLGACNSGSSKTVAPLTGGVAQATGGASGGVQSSGGIPAIGGARTGGATTGGIMVTGGIVTTGGIVVTGGSAQGGIVATGGSRPDLSTGGQVPQDASVMRDQAEPSDGREPPAQDGPSRPDLAQERPAPDTGSSTSSVFKPAFILGADVTITVEDEYWGATYTDNGQAKSLEQILKDHGFNFIRIATFVNPGAAGGYAEGKVEPFRDLAHTLTLAKRVKKIGMGFMLDLHYSDTWASPSAQATPAAWAGLSLSALETKMYDYTKDALTQLKAQGAMPDMVSVGNEIPNGMLWENGHVTNSNFVNFARLLKAGIRAVREIDPAIVVVLHIEKCNNYATTKWWLDGVLGQGVAFDVLGQSCYATAPNGVAGYQGTPAEWKATFGQLVTAYPNLKFLIAEYSAEQRAAGDVMFGLPDNRGLGTFNWDPTRAYDTHPNDPIFSTNGAWNRYVAIPEKMSLYEKMAKDFGARPAMLNSR